MRIWAACRGGRGAALGGPRAALVLRGCHLEVLMLLNKGSPVFVLRWVLHVTRLVAPTGTRFLFRCSRLCLFRSLMFLR